MRRSRERTKYVRGTRLGADGRHGKVFAVEPLGKGRPCLAMKQFRRNYNVGKLRQEYELQADAACFGLSPKVVDCRQGDRQIIMHRLGANLYDELRASGGRMSVRRQRQMYRIFRELDAHGIAHGDPNPLNFMLDGQGSMYIIDFGMASRVPKGGRQNRERMTLGMVLRLLEIFPDAPPPRYLLQRLPDSFRAIALSAREARRRTPDAQQRAL